MVTFIGAIVIKFSLCGCVQLICYWPLKNVRGSISQQLPPDECWPSYGIHCTQAGHLRYGIALLATVFWCALPLSMLS